MIPSNDIKAENVLVTENSWFVYGETPRAPLIWLMRQL